MISQCLQEERKSPTHLDSEGCNVLSLVDVVVEAGGEREETMGCDEELLHHVSVEWK